MLQFYLKNDFIKSYNSFASQKLIKTDKEYNYEILNTIALLSSLPAKKKTRRLSRGYLIMKHN